MPPDGQGDFAVALAGRGCFKFGDAFFKVGAAVSAEVGGIDRCWCEEQ